ncbi:MAG: flavin reductase family protein [Pseudonocardiaceae bacterium]
MERPAHGTHGPAGPGRGNGRSASLPGQSVDDVERRADRPFSLPLTTKENPMMTSSKSERYTSICSPSEMRSLMASFPTGVTIVTAVDSAGRPRGMTCSSLCSVTLDPPTLLICLRRQSPTLRATQQSGMFAVNLIHAAARATAELFASGSMYRFDRVRWNLDPDSAGPHLLNDAHAVADCRVSGAELVGDHAVVFGEVTRVTRQPGPTPLLYGLRHYATWRES